MLINHSGGSNHLSYGINMISFLYISQFENGLFYQNFGTKIFPIFYNRLSPKYM